MMNHCNRGYSESLEKMIVLWGVIFADIHNHQTLSLVTSKSFSLGPTTSKSQVRETDVKWFCPLSMTSPVKPMSYRIGLTPYYLKKVVGIYCDSNGLVPLLVSGKRAKNVTVWYRIYRKRCLRKLWGSKVVTHYWNFNLWWCLYKK